MNIIIEPDSFSFRLQSGTGNEIVYGNFYLEIGNRFFPNQHWNDFIVRLLLSWAHNLLNYEAGLLCFFDGAYEIEFVKEDKDIILTMDGLGECKIEISDFYKGLSRCLMAVEEYVKKNNILISKQNTIQQYIRQLKNSC